VGVTLRLPAASEKRQEQEKTLRTSRKMETARSGAVRMSSAWRSLWKSYRTRPAKITRPATE
jgi:hypothetical protein